MDIIELSHLARILREVVLRAGRDGVDLPISVGELAVFENVARYADITISEISHHTGLAQSRVSTIVRELAEQGVFLLNKVPPDRRQTRVRLAPEVRQQTFDDYGTRPVDGALAAVVPHLSEQETQHALDLLHELFELFNRPDQR